MALVLNVKCVENLKGKLDRQAKATFRGHTYSSKIVQSAKRVAYFGESFEWPVARAVQDDEFIFITVLNFNKYLSNKQVGTFNLSLQQVIQDGQIQVSEQLIDSSNRLLEELLTFEVRYYSPDGKVGDWENQEFHYPLIEDLRPKEKREKMDIIPGFDGNSLIGELGEDELTGQITSKADLPGEDTGSQTMLIQQMYEIKKKRPELLEQELHKPRDFQICITIIEGLQFAGLDIDPVIRIDVGEDKKYTTIKQSSNSPFYNEYFVFDFCESPAMIFDKMITLTALHAHKIPGRQLIRAGNFVSGRTIGQFKCDVGTVYSAPDHNYFHKWAVLIDPKDTSEGVKGYIKCDISVLGKGDILRIPKHSSKDDDAVNLEGNLLLPKGVPMDRQRATYQVIIYRAEDLPRTDLGIMASVRKAIGGHPVAMVDGLVKVSFAGLVGKTTVKRNYHPEWRESLTFLELFPPLCNRIKVQLCDSEITTDEPIGTHFIELSQIMDPGGDSDGILPTYGPNWINFYGAPRHYKIIGEHEDLNEGLGEGAAFRGRLLMSIKTEIIDSEAAGPTTVTREKLRSSTRTDVAPRKEFLLFGTFFEATMLDKELKDKPVIFEISIGVNGMVPEEDGQFGNIFDRKAVKSIMDDSDDESESDEEDEKSRIIRKKKEEEVSLPAESTTGVQMPIAMDKNYCYMPFNNNKPCTYVVSIFEDLRKRLYHINLIEHALTLIEEGLEDVRQMLINEHVNTHRRLRGVMSEFMRGVDKYMKLAGSLGIGAGSGKTKLDKYRQKMCRKTLEKLRGQADTLKSKVNNENVKEKFREAKEIAKKVKHLSKEPQHSLPDVFIWMLCEKKRIAYYRIPAKDLISATDEDMKGKHCGKVCTIFLKKPGKKNQGSSGWVMQAKLELLLWLGLKNPMKEYMQGIPVGYELTKEMRTNPLPPTILYYPENHTFQLRAYIFQARSLLGSDDTGLSDPFARVLISNQCKSTQVIDATLSPNYDETLVFDDIVLYGPIEQIVDNPPVVIIEFYDYDVVGKPEFLGRAMVKPKVKSADVSYDLPQFPPQLEWWDVHRGTRNAGELLASFELLLKPTHEDEIPAPPSQIPFKHNPKVLITPLPPAIKPTLSHYRLEVMFWGVRELRKIQLMSVEHPRVDIECAGAVLSSKRIELITKNSNFEDPVTYMDVDLPDNQLFWPPITIRVVDCRLFGRTVLVGVHTINHINKYIWVSPEEKMITHHDDDEKNSVANQLISPNHLKVASQLDDARSRASVNMSIKANLEDTKSIRSRLSGNISRKGVLEDSRSIRSTASPSISRKANLEDTKSVKSRLSANISRKVNLDDAKSIRSTASPSISRKGLLEESRSKGSANLSMKAALIEEDTKSIRSAKSGKMSTKDGQTGNGSAIAPGSVAINMDVKSMSHVSTNNNNNSLTQVPDITIQQPGHTTVNMPPMSGQQTQPAIGPNGQPTQPAVGPNGQPLPPPVGPNGQPLPPAVGPNGQPLPPTLGPNGQPIGQAGMPIDPNAQEQARKQKKDMMVDLDWWSKYYVTKEDVDKKRRKELKEKLKKQGATVDSSDEELLADADFREQYPDLIDYSLLDAKNLKELQELAEQKRKEEEAKMDEETKKKDKKNKKKKKKKKEKKKAKGEINEGFDDDFDDGDLDDPVIQEDEMDDGDKSNIERFKFYDCDLENTKFFGGFKDNFETFELYRGKKLDDADEEDISRIAGKFKGNLCIYKTKPTDEDDDTASVNSLKLKRKAQKEAEVKTTLKLLRGLPSWKPHEVQVHVYIVKAIDLHPTDMNGKADPYLILKCGTREINDKPNHLNNNLNPVFGKLFEFEANFPMDSILHIQVNDYDLLSSDDMIGETVIDLEDRFHSKHRGTCGFPKLYELYGYNIWRDTQKPSQILEKLCKTIEIDQPQYKATSVFCGGKTYHGEEKVELETGELVPSTENLALEVIKHWEEMPGGCKLVPEHLETRTLHNPERPGVEQGRLEMWVDLFPKDLPAPTITVDITPRQPKEYELRVIIWNTDDVVLEDENFVTGEKSSDIFVRGYVLGRGEDDQQTDVHYRSLTGEGNFNWRFIFPFKYLKAEEKVVHSKKMSVFDMDDTEIKVPPILTMQVWDADLVSADDFLGSIAINLNRVPRPAKDAKKCKINLLKKDGSVPTINLFKNKRCKGWWPMGAKDSDGARIVGKVEAELHLMSLEEAEKSPAGKARQEPDPLPEPNRPDASFLWCMNPLKTIKYILWRNYKWTILKALLITILIVFIGLVLYNVPGASVNKIFNTGAG